MSDAVPGRSRRNWSPGSAPRPCRPSTRPSHSWTRRARAIPASRCVRASADALPFPDRTFDAALAQLVVHFMPDPVAGLAEMARVTRRDGVVAACVWDHARRSRSAPRVLGGRARARPWGRGRIAARGCSRGTPRGAVRRRGAPRRRRATLSASLEHPTFDEWWEPYTDGVGPAGSYLASLDPERRTVLRERCRAMLPDEPFVLTSWAWAARGLV